MDIKETSNRVRKAVGGKIDSSDESSVLSAGWEAMQAANPNMAAAVTKMPPQIANNVVLQYTNAIRMGQIDQANDMAINAARDSFASYAQPEAKKVAGPRIGKALAQSQTNPEMITDFASFESMLNAPQANTAKPSPFGPVARKINSTLGASKPQAQVNPQAAFSKVQDQYQKFNQAKWGDYEKALVWGRPKDRDLTGTGSWRPAEPAPGNVNSNPFGGN